MDDQFNGRTDDDLFADEFEPVAEPPAEPAPVAASAPSSNAVTDKQTTTTAATTTVSPQKDTSAPEQKSIPAAPRSLAQSRHNKPANSRPPRQQANVPTNTPAQPSNAAPNTNAQPPTGPAVKADPQARLRSGANPRTKLTDDELNAKMEAMRIASAEKARRFEQTQRDEQAHDIAYARGMEEARKRKVVEEEKKRKGEEDRRRLDDEREKNRERKLKAMGMKEGGWDEGKEQREEEERRRGNNFRGAHGGLRGANMGMANSRFALERFLAEDDGPDLGPPKEFGFDEFRGRGRGGRGRGASARGRGNRGRFGDRNGGFREDKEDVNASPSQPNHQKADQRPVTSKEDFPALPGAAAPQKIDTKAGAAQSFASPLSPPIGDWADEVTAKTASRRV